MSDSEIIRALESRLNELKVELGLLEGRFQDTRGTINKNEITNNKLEEDLIQLRFKVNKIYLDVENIERGLEEIKPVLDKLSGKLDKITSNALFQFTSDLDSKKILTIISAIIILIGSPTALTTITNNSAPNTQKLDKLIELLEKQP